VSTARLVATLVVLLVPAAHAAHPLRIGTTTSVQDSGLLDALLPAYERATGSRPDVIAVGTGAAFKLARDGNVDLLLVHDREGEDEFVRSGDGAARRPLMWNTFEIIGPESDPAGTRGSHSGAEALARIARARAPFVSRADDSGTDRCEKRLWKADGGRPSWPGYRESGQGMGATLRIADELGAYVLGDRGTRLGYRGHLALVPLVADTPDLRNEYAVVLIDPKRHPDLDHEGARRLADWLASAEAARLIDGYRVGGQPLFHALRSE
jgi:tungstate transport system substrate-binding protein